MRFACRIAQRKAETTVDTIVLHKRQEALEANAAPQLEAPPPPPAATDNDTDTNAAAAPVVAAGPQLPDGSDDDASALPEWMELSDGRFSPAPIAEDDVPAGAEIVDEEDDRELLMYLRRQVSVDSMISASCSAAADIFLVAHELLIADAAVASQVLLLSDIWSRNRNPTKARLLQSTAAWLTPPVAAGSGRGREGSGCGSCARPNAATARQWCLRTCRRWGG